MGFVLLGSLISPAFAYGFVVACASILGLVAAGAVALGLFSLIMGAGFVTVGACRGFKAGDRATIAWTLAALIYFAPFVIGWLYKAFY